MKRAATFILLVCLALASAADEQPDRESLIAAWEAHVRMLPGTERLEATGDGTYILEDSDLPYQGELKITGALVRLSESVGYETGISHTGMIDFELVDLPPDRLSSQVYYYWLSDRQMMYYSATAGEWLNSAAYQASLTETFGGGTSYGVLSFMLSYGVWILLLGLLIIGFVSIGRQTRKARSLMDDSEAVNRKASDNLDRAREMQDEVLAIARETRDLQAQSNELLKQMLEALKR